MKFVAEKKALLKALVLASSVVENKNTIPILSNLKLVAAGETVSLTATDLDIQVSQKVRAEVAIDGAITVQASMLKDIVSKLSDGAQIEFDLRAEKHGNLLSVRSGKSSFRLQTLPVEDFPDLASGDLPAQITFDAPQFHRLFEVTSFAVSQEETRYYLNGVYLHLHGHECRTVATDGHRLAMCWCDPPLGSEGMPGVIVPRKTVNLLRRHLDGVSGEVKISVSPSKIMVQWGAVELVSKLIDGTFPDYERVIPKSSNTTAILDVKALSHVVDRMTTVAMEKGRAVRFAFAPGKLMVSMSSPDTGSAEEDMEVDFEGPAVEIGFNNRYVSDALSHVGAKQIRLEITDGGSPTVMLPNGEPQDFKFVLMPVRL